MIITSSAPARLSLGGGGTDVPPYCFSHGSLVLNMAINIRSHFTLYTYPHTLEYLKENEVPRNGDKNFVYAFLDEFNHKSWHDSKFYSSFDGFLQAGLGSSASSGVSFVSALSLEQGLKLSKLEIALKARGIEVDRLGLFSGYQDFIASSYGGVNIIKIDKVKGIEVTQLDKGYVDSLLPWVTLFYAGGTRISAKIQEGLKKPSQSQIKALTKMKQLCFKSIEALDKKNIALFGSLLHQTWEFKKQSNKNVSNRWIDHIYNLALKSGALGGKLCGSGGQGYMFLVTPPDKQKDLIANLGRIGVIDIPFAIDYEGVTTTIDKH